MCISFIDLLTRRNIELTPVYGIFFNALANSSPYASTVTLGNTLRGKIVFTLVYISMWRQLQNVAFTRFVVVHVYALVIFRTWLKKKKKFTECRLTHNKRKPQLGLYEIYLLYTKSTEGRDAFLINFEALKRGKIFSSVVDDEEMLCFSLRIRTGYVPVASGRTPRP